MRVAWAWSPILWCLAAALNAGTDTRALSEYQKQDWSVEDGLPQGNVRAIVQDPSGVLLIGTGGGMATFDGLRFTPVKVDERDVVANEPVNAVLYSRTGDLWIGTDGRGVIHRKGGQSISVSEGAGLTQERVRSMLEDSDGVIWVGTQNGVERIVGDRVECLSALGLVPGDVTSPFAADGAGGMFIVTVKGLFHWAHDAAPPVLLRHTELGSVTAAYADARGRVWIGMQRGALELVNGAAGWNDVLVPSSHGPVAAILMDRENNLWLGTRGHGICRLSRAGMLTHWTTADGLADDFIRRLFEDNEGNLWIGMLGGGLSRWRRATLIPYGQPEGLPQGFASTVLGDARGDLWLGTWGQGLFRLHQGQLSRVALPGTLRQSPIRALAEDRRGGVWIGTWYDGLYHFDGLGIERYLTGSESFSNAISALVVDRNGSLWVGTYSGLLKYEGGFPHPKQGQLLLPGKMITCVKEAPSGEILVGTQQGLYIIQGAFVTALTMKDGLPNDAVISISIDSGDGIWIGTKAGGLDRIVNHRVIRTPSNSGLPAFQIYSVLDDRNGMLWMGSTRGVLKVSRVQLHEWSEGRRKTLDVAVLGKSDGMRSSECGGLSQPPAARIQDGSLWFATAKGFAHANPLQVMETPPPASPRIAGLTIDHNPVAALDRIVIPPGKSDVDFQFDAVRLSDPAQLQFRCKLESYDADWIVTRSRHMLYRRLPPGKYRFAVSVRDHQGPWSERLASIDVEQEPHYYQRWWFYALLAGLAAGLIAMVFHQRLGRAKARVAWILEERNRIAREWHDTLMADFAAISWQLEATKNRLESAPREAVSSLELTRTMVKHCQTEARRIIWDLRGGEEPVGLLSEELNKTLSLMGPRAELETRLLIEGEERRLPPVCVHHLVCIGQEAVTNALRHASPQTVKIQVVYSADRISMTVRDNGSGFRPPESPQATPGHFGLAVMHERAKKLGGDLRIYSAPGAGTEIWVDVPA
ncbi:MAG TPA: two-component regulator propeller domain-containing protein [Bryobacteraceae bacterium]|nr:two-component regulator propeller domain-containing protein [Bryobacteraceae bacterium]